MNRRALREHQAQGIDNISVNAADLLAYLERRARGAEPADLLSETMTTAWRRIDAMPADATEARMWLFGIARNVLANAERSAQRRWKLADRLRDHLTTSAPAIDDELAMDVREAVGKLTPDLQELIGLVHWDGFTVAEAARLIGVPASTARSRYQTARQQLAALLTVTIR